jgi:SH3-like domain-containing protein
MGGLVSAGLVSAGLGGGVIVRGLAGGLVPALQAQEMPMVRPKPRPVAESPADTAPATTSGTEATPALAAPETAAPPAPVRAKPPQRDPTRGSVTNLPLPRFVSLKGKEGNARRGPGLTHRIDWVFTRAGMPLKITAEYEHWRRVEDAEGAGGWVHYSLLSGVRSVLVNVDMADLHSDPEDGASVVVQAERNVVGWVQECLPDWCRISVEGADGWSRGWVRKAALWGVLPGEVIE